MKSSKALAIVGVIALLVVLSCIFTVHEGQQALVLRLGKIQRDSAGQAKVKQPGLHLKLPIIAHARYFDVKLQTLDIKSSRIVTNEKKDVLVDYYVKWRINNLPYFYTRASGDPRQAEILLEQQLNDSLRGEFGRRTIREVISDDREAIMNKLQAQAAATAKKLGIDVVDVRIKRIDLPTEVSKAVFDRMRAERERVATEHRAEGKAKAEALKAAADAQATVIVAQANAKANQLRGDGDAVSTKIYADAYRQDPSYYAFYRSLEAYANSFHDKGDILLLRPDSQFFKYFESATGNHKKSVASAKDKA